MEHCSLQSCKDLYSIYKTCQRFSQSPILHAVQCCAKSIEIPGVVGAGVVSVIVGVGVSFGVGVGTVTK